MPDFVLDTSAFINGWRHHYRLPVFEGVWDALGEAMDRGVVASPSEVLVELSKKAGDALHTWALGHPAAFVAPEASWIPHVGAIRPYAPHWFDGAGRDEAAACVCNMPAPTRGWAFRAHR